MPENDSLFASSLHELVVHYVTPIDLHSLGARGLYQVNLFTCHAE